MLSQLKLKAFIPTTQLVKARKFYIEKLGLRILSEDNYGLECESNGTHLRITIVESLIPQPFTVLGWDTVDIISTVMRLGEKGIIFERYSFIEQDELGIWTAPDGTRVAWFKDPDGNVLSISE